MVDLDAVRWACQPIAQWWQAHLATGDADPETLDAALAAARALGPVPGRLGAALAYIIAGCPDLDYAGACAAFTRVAHAGRPTPDPLGTSHDAQPTLPGLTAPQAKPRTATDTRP